MENAVFDKKMCFLYTKNAGFCTENAGFLCTLFKIAAILRYYASPDKMRLPSKRVKRAENTTLEREDKTIF